MTGLGHSTRPCIFSVFRGHIHNCVKRVVQRKVLKLQSDLEEAKAESRYLRARPVDSPVVATNRSQFTTTPVPRYDGVSDWDQYREVFEAIVASNGRPDCCPTVDFTFGWGSPERGFVGTR